MDSKIWYIPAKNDRLDKKVGFFAVSVQMIKNSFTASQHKFLL